MKLGKGIHWWDFAMTLALSGWAVFDHNVLAMGLCILMLADIRTRIAAVALIDYQRRYITHLEGVNGRDR